MLKRESLNSFFFLCCVCVFFCIVTLVQVFIFHTWLIAVEAENHCSNRSCYSDPCGLPESCANQLSCCIATKGVACLALVPFFSKNTRHSLIGQD